MNIDGHTFHLVPTFISWHVESEMFEVRETRRKTLFQDLCRLKFGRDPD